ncbi:MAG: winged helix-turn-helix transcriptional regulator [Thaumarchaeota archaeon]|nr:winged helix-turn-helix transcriptional regulator [Nitrososphaerota archaeon]
MSDETRFSILQHIGSGELSVGEIAGMVRRDQPLVSHHLKILKECGIVSCTARGRRSMYSVSSPRLASLIRDIAEAGEQMDELCTEACCGIPESGEASGQAGIRGAARRRPNVIQND